MQICQYEVSAHMEFISKKQNETDQGMSREGSVIQNSSWFSSRGEKRAYETHELELVLYPVSIFPSLPTGHGNAFVSRWVHLNFRCHFS